MRSYSNDLRQKVLQLDDGKTSVREAAARLKVGKTFVANCWNRFRKTGLTTAMRQGGYKVSMLQNHSSAIRSWIKSNPSITLDEMLELCVSQLGVRVGRMTMWDHLDRMGLTFKKNSARSGARQARREGAARSVETKPAASRRKKTGVS